MPDPAIFLTGTGTGVGKSVVGCALAAAWAARGLGPRVFKPAESGCERRGGALHPEDAWTLRQAAGDPRPIEEVCPYRYALPLAPAHAAEEEGNPPDAGRLLGMIAALRRAPGPLLVEGAGGLLVPLAPGLQMIDLARGAGLGLLIVAPVGLGTLNHTQLTVRAARAEGIPVAGIVLNDLTGEDTPAARRNPGAIEELCGAPLLGVFPHLPGIGAELRRGAGPGTPAAARLAEAAERLDLAALGNT
ncbi:MAG: dethiobiotin synthase [Candidatus Tectomicrobia bacterium]|uniref:ATP-dependent dethiobiotin synthetase BioD n=1 Tax=Tectimicrobiota bacterium TaxID=2528274 RepID=A0A932MNZ0_UNCTE|nr:dethiobiotin synthase [Candidatus Tectomicrobia bacterium]